MKAMSAREQPAAKHPRVIGAPRIIMLAGGNSQQCNWNWHSPLLWSDELWTHYYAYYVVIMHVMYGDY